MQKLPKEFVELCKSVTAKRPKTVIDHILEHGYITTEELKEIPKFVKEIIQKELSRKRAHPVVRGG
jgi:transcription initiation factor IIE alpha subunit